jgi:hypothetical protein
MEKTANRFRKWAPIWFMMALMVTAAGVAGCAAMRTGQGGDTIAKTLWQSRDQYVAIEKQDRSAGVTATANAHPADISVDRLRSALASMEVRLPGKDKKVPLFYDPELKILSENIRAGLASAAPDEDVTFAVIGHYPALLGILRERKVTTGRVFCRDGRLNIIFGDVLRDVREDEDRRLYPFLPGSRGAAAPGKWALTAKQEGEPFTMTRPDWVTFPLAGPPAPIAAPAARQENDSTGAENKEAPAVSPEKPVAPVKKSIEERLVILNELRNKNLITEEEYRQKRLGILNEL